MCSTIQQETKAFIRQLRATCIDFSSSSSEDSSDDNAKLQEQGDQFSIFSQQIHTNTLRLCTIFHRAPQHEAKLEEDHAKLFFTTCVETQEANNILIPQILQKVNEDYTFLTEYHPSKNFRERKTSIILKQNLIEDLYQVTKEGQILFRRALKGFKVPRNTLHKSPIYRSSQFMLKYLNDVLLCGKTLNFDEIPDLNHATLVFTNKQQFDDIVTMINQHFNVLYVKNYLKQTLPSFQNLHICVQVSLKSPESSLTSLLLNEVYTCTLYLTLKNLWEIQKNVTPLHHLEVEKTQVPVICPLCHCWPQSVIKSEITNLIPEAISHWIYNIGTWRNQKVMYKLEASGSLAVVKRRQLLKFVKQAAHLRHPNSIHLLGMVDTPTEIGLLWSWQDETCFLSCLLTQLTEEECYIAAIQLCNVCIYLHENKQLLFDMRTSALLCTKQPFQIKLTNPSPQPISYTKEVIPESQFFSPAYATFSPERLRNPGSRSAARSIACDVYSFGCFLIELFGKNHHSPWKDLSQLSVRTRMEKAQKPPQIMHIENENIKSLVNSCLEFDPKNRPCMKLLKTCLEEQLFQFKKKLW